ncbi:MAG TPA: toxic anion resistance protein, partial [Marinobacter sp.]|nr:toxic anion resistance protein [Marinobacter sp.]
YNTISTLTIPVWKRQMLMGLSLEEQADSVELAEKIDDFTNELLRKQADLLKKNTLATARANQRLVIDVETIQHVQKTLIDTVTEVNSIQDRASADREAAVEKIMGLRSQVNERLLGSNESPSRNIH